MSSPHPLDRPVWSALNGRQSHLAIRRGGAVRFDPQFGMFAAVDGSPESLAALGALIGELGEVALVEPEPPPVIPGAVVKSTAICWQMMAEGFPATPPTEPAETLQAADAAEMLALATLTKPGPFFARTNELGRFVGVRSDGKLVAMAGERMKPPGFVEVSGVCTHPDHRGQGYAATLMRQVAARIASEGETPFLHSYADNAGAIALYERLGFRFRRELIMTVLAPA